MPQPQVGDPNLPSYAEMRLDSSNRHARQVSHRLTIITHKRVVNPPLINPHTARNKHVSVRVPVVINNLVRTKRTTYTNGNASILYRHILALINSSQCSQTRTVMPIARILSPHKPRGSKRIRPHNACPARALQKPTPHRRGSLHPILLPVQIDHLLIGPPLINQQSASLILVHDLPLRHDDINPSRLLGKLVTQGTSCHTGNPRDKPQP